MNKQSRPAPAVAYLALGWGVQSFTIAAMCALGEIKGLTLAIHADTGHESSFTYEFARRWTPWLREHGVDVATVKADQQEWMVPHGKRGTINIYIPAFTKSHADGRGGQIRRQCTQHWKIYPMRRHARSLLPGRQVYPGAVEAWMGISTDEWRRIRDSEVRYVTNRYPLLELRMSRADCAAWLERHGLEVPPKSSCTFCPFHSGQHWRDMKKRGGLDWEEAVTVDSLVRHTRDQHDVFVHPNLLPLEEAVRIPEDYNATQLELDLPCDSGTCFV